jgi:hypothetical protein
MGFTERVAGKAGDESPYLLNFSGFMDALNGRGEKFLSDSLDDVAPLFVQRPTQYVGDGFDSRD